MKLWSCHDVACPSCSAAIGIYCTRRYGTPMMGYHLDRHGDLRLLIRSARRRS